MRAGCSKRWDGAGLVDDSNRFECHRSRQAEAEPGHAEMRAASWQLVFDGVSSRFLHWSQKKHPVEAGSNGTADAGAGSET
ncbi:hypothetical protein, partial [Paenibacillus sinopodophylli]|uniref:hypothetical protein n=1 Tax=Paenibacillus sinopodophylli TaxID=1837342 RepID=UPI00110D1FC7